MLQQSYLSYSTASANERAHGAASSRKTSTSYVVLTKREVAQPTPARPRHHQLGPTEAEAIHQCGP
eukprot:2459715-Pyramimonas_sp.AAC.1